MIAELSADFYDIQGHRTFGPGTRGKRVGFRPTAPMGSYLTQPLQIKCKDFSEIRRFLLNCRWRSIRKVRQQEHWKSPEEFEKTRVGNCVAFALWTWRQVLSMGYTARFVGGKSGKFGEGHTWVTFEKDGKWYLLEPQLRRIGLRMPRLSTLRYHPRVSVGWEGNKIQYFDHDDRSAEPPLPTLPGLVAEWVLLRSRLWIQVPIVLIRIMWLLPFGIFQRLTNRSEPPR
jgi:hypothetical protein